MFVPEIKVTVSNDKLGDLAKILKELENLELLVGVPMETTGRNNSGMTNAELAWIHTNGSPLRHIPPRPIIEPALEDPANRAILTRDLEQVVLAAVDGDIKLAEKRLNMTGMDAQNMVRGWFVNPSNNWARNRPATIAMKRSDMPLIDTGQLRRSMTYVIRSKDTGAEKEKSATHLQMAEGIAGGIAGGQVGGKVGAVAGAATGGGLGAFVGYWGGSITGSQIGSSLATGGKGIGPVGGIFRILDIFV